MWPLHVIDAVFQMFLSKIVPGNIYVYIRSLAQDQFACPIYSCAYINGSIIVIKATVVMSIIIIANRATDEQQSIIVIDNRAIQGATSAQVPSPRNRVKDVQPYDEGL